MPKAGKKARIAAIESLKGTNPVDAAKIGEFASPDKVYAEIGKQEPIANMLTFASFRKQKQTEAILNYWADWLSMEVEGTLTWRDRIKVSELIAKHLGMIGGDGSTTINVAHFDLKNASASDLMSKLQELKAAKELEEAKSKAIDSSAN